ncbi:MAG: DAK2 domain-containing protein [Dermatophilaceae bacterium]
MAELTRLDAAAGWRWLFASRQALAVRRAELDALNVYPVPDGDTGTNLYLTLSTAIDRLLSTGMTAADRGLTQAMDALVREALLAARGNSGVILSQYLRGVAEAIRAVPDADTLGLGPAALVAVLDCARRRAREGVGEPVEGTILTVADDTARAAQVALEDGADLAGLVTAALAGARESLALTPSRLPLLRRAGVVDAGGAGLVVMFAKLVEVVTGRPVHLGRLGPSVQPALPHLDGDGVYEVMYVVRGLDARGRAWLRAVLSLLGDAVVVAGDEGVATAHVHTDDPGIAIEAALDLGRPEAIRVQWLGHNPPGAGVSGPAAREQVSAPVGSPGALVPVGAPRAEGTGRDVRASTGVIACASGPRLAAVMAGLGACVVPSAPGRRATTGDLLRARRALDAESVILLANHDDTLLAAETAGRIARDEGLPSSVVPTRSAVAGLAALALFDPDGPAPTVAARMAEAAHACRSGMVVRATRRATTAAGECAPGDIVAYAGPEALVIGDDPDALADALVRALIGEGAELVTMISGGTPGEELAARVSDRLQVSYPEVEVCRIEGDSTTYDLLVGVE